MSPTPSSPPGYRRAEPAAQSASNGLWRPPFYFTVLASAVLFGSFHEVCIRQALAFGTEDAGPGHLLGTAVGTLAAVVGLLGTHCWRSRGAERLPPLLLLGSIGVALSAAVLFVSFDSATHVFWRGVCSAAVGFLLGASLSMLQAAMARLWRQFELVRYLLNPFRLTSILACGVLAVMTVPLIGFLRSSLLLGVLLCLLAYWHCRVYAYTERTELRGTRHFERSALLLGCSYALAFWASERWVTREQLGYFQGAILHTVSGDRSEVVVTTGPDGLQLFENRMLRAADVDTHRYFEALVHPAFAAASRHARVLLLGSGDGFAEREILRYPDVHTLDVVAPDLAMARYAARAPWLLERTDAAMRSAKIKLTQAEPIVWLERDHGRYDVVIVDLGDPETPRWGKNFTTYFYERLDAHLSETGVASVQASSIFTTPDTFANIARSMRAAALVARPYHVAVSSIGDWGFVLAAKHPFEEPRRLTATTRYLTDETLRSSLYIPRDSRGDAGSPSTLYDQRVVALFNRERRAR